VRTPDRGVAGERQLLARGEDAQPVVGLGVRRGQQERRLGQVVQWAKARISSSVTPSASWTTATGLPLSGIVENTSTWEKGRMAGG